MPLGYCIPDPHSATLHKDVIAALETSSASQRLVTPQHICKMITVIVWVRNARCISAVWERHAYNTGPFVGPCAHADNSIPEPKVSLRGMCNTPVH